MTAYILRRCGRNVPAAAQLDTGGDYDPAALWLRDLVASLTGDVTLAMPSERWAADQVERLYASAKCPITFHDIRRDEHGKRIALLARGAGGSVTPAQICHAARAEWAEIDRQKRGGVWYTAVLLDYSA